jgi:hypothetical protein
MAEDGDIAAVVQRALQARDQGIQILSGAASFGIVIAALAITMPAIEAGLTLTALGPAIMLVVMALLVNDLILWGPRGRSRIGAVCAAAAPLLVAFGFTTILASVDAGTDNQPLIIVLNILWLPLMLAAMHTGHLILSGKDDAVRYRAIAQLFGVGIGVSIILSSPLTAVWHAILPALFIIPASYSLVVGGPDRAQVKEFKRALDTAEERVLLLRSKGVTVDQSASLVNSARGIGYREPRIGLRILSEALDDIERIVALSNDLGAIRQESESAVAEAKKIAPMATRPARCMTTGDRESELGSLRDAEQLYREAKRRSIEISSHWKPAEDAIAAARAAISAVGGVDRERLDGLLQAASEALDREEPADARTIAESIPPHVENTSEATVGAEGALEEARAALGRVEGLDCTEWQERLAEADLAIQNGDASLARGLADSIQREIITVGEAKTMVQRALRQRRKMTEQWSERGDASTWDERLAEVKESAAAGRWVEAKENLDSITSDLDAVGQAVGETTELLDFVKDEWRSLRARLESSGVKAANDDRRACEAAVGAASKALERGDVEDALVALGEADGLMERLRRLT